MRIPFKQKKGGGEKKRRRGSLGDTRSETPLRGKNERKEGDRGEKEEGGVGEEGGIPSSRRGTNYGNRRRHLFEGDRFNLDDIVKGRTSKRE